MKNGQVKSIENQKRAIPPGDERRLYKYAVLSKLLSGGCITIVRDWGVVTSAQAAANGSREARGSPPLIWNVFPTCQSVQNGLYLL